MEGTARHLSRAARAAIACVAVAAALLLALRASSEAAVGPTATTSATAAAGQTATTSATARVTIANYKFHPPTLTVAKGTTVTFANTSGVAHTATRGGAFDTRRIKPGRSVAARFTKKGTFSYHCKIHPFMHGTIVVR
jgi:plastocyanin